MKTTKILLIFGLITFSPILLNLESNRDKFDCNNDYARIDLLNPSTNENAEIIDSLFNRKINDYDELGFFPQFYEPSLQATYHALYTLDVLDKLTIINQEKILDYVMSQFKEDSGLFIDLYALRYLDMDLDLVYYPLISLLETQCYAILSLEILNSLDLIDAQSFITFIWSCFNPQGDSNGFIGLPWNPELEGKFQIATMDNTYFAIQALNVLGIDWSAHGGEVTKLIQFINSLQSTTFYFGGFFNDVDMIFDSLDTFMSDVNPLSCLYCLKSLKEFNYLDSIRMNDFHQYLDSIYDDTTCTFEMNSFKHSCDLIASAIGLELADMTNYNEIDKGGIFNFILINRNELGNWDRSTIYGYHESIASFQILRSLNDLGLISQIPETVKNEIATAVVLYQQPSGFSPLSVDYTSVDLLYAVTNAFTLHDPINELDISAIYELLEGCYFTAKFHEFFGCTGMDPGFRFFLISPIEYSCVVHQDLLNYTRFTRSHEWAYKVLNSLKALHKLNDFGYDYNLTKLINDVISTQFLAEGFKNYGSFMPMDFYTLMSEEQQNKTVSLRNSYYALKTLDLLAEFLGLGPLDNFNFNEIALFNFIKQNLVETNDSIYYSPEHASSKDVTLEETYYVSWILKEIGLFGLNTSKITRFVLENLDYDNIHSIYYSFKLQHLLDLDFKFNFTLTNALLEKVYCQDYCELYKSSDRKGIEQGAILWVMEMIKEDNLAVECDYDPSVPLGSVTTLSTSVQSMFLSYQNKDISVFFESESLGRFSFELMPDSSFQASFKVPEKPDFFPEFSGDVVIERYSSEIEQLPVHIQTSYGLTHALRVNTESNKCTFEIDVSQVFTSGKYPSTNSTVFLEVYSEDTLKGMFQLDRQDYEHHSTFSITHIPNAQTDHYFRFILFDDFNPSGLELENWEVDIEPDDPENNQTQYIVIGFTIGSLIVGIASFFLFRKKRQVVVNNYIQSSNKDEKITSSEDAVFKYMKKRNTK